MTLKRSIIAGAVGAALAVGVAGLAQQRFRGFDQTPEPRWGVPTWEVDQRFKSDVFTFARVHYQSEYEVTGNSYFGGGRGRGRRNRGGGFRNDGFEPVGPPDYAGEYGPGWGTDGPQSDLDFSFRLQQLTSFKVNPNPTTVRLDDERLFEFPFIYMIEPGTGNLYFSDAEIVNLRRYLLNGGFMMVDDFWGDWEYEVFYRQIKRVFPDREPKEVPIEHEIFRCVYNIKEKPQVPNYSEAEQGRAWGITYEDHGPGSEQVHYRAIYDDKDRIMVFICHNTDLGDGWEREGNNEWYFHNFCENKSYPMGINIVTYALTH